MIAPRKRKVGKYHQALLSLRTGMRPINKQKNTGKNASTFPCIFIYLFVRLNAKHNYSIIVAARPDPTVRPPSRIANVNP